MRTDAIKTGGPAFPHDLGHLDDPNTGGMTLRDYFAAKALPSDYADAIRTEAWKNDDQWRASVAMDAYAMADAMLKARSQS